MDAPAPTVGMIIPMRGIGLVELLLGGFMLWIAFGPHTVPPRWTTATRNLALSGVGAICLGCYILTDTRVFAWLGYPALAITLVVPWFDRSFREITLHPRRWRRQQEAQQQAFLQLLKDLNASPPPERADPR